MDDAERERLLAELREPRPEAAETIAITKAVRARLRPDGIHQQRVEAARRRLLQVLDRRVVAYSKELERQTYEVGFNFATTPPSKRPEPVHFTEALRPLIDEEVVIPIDARVLGQSARFFALRGKPYEAVEEAFEWKLAAVLAYQRVERVPAISGYHAEAVMHAALVESGAWHSVGWQGGVPIVRLHDKKVSAGDVDLAGFDRATGLPFVAQVKNGREWFYETDDVVWHLLGAAAELEAVPILIARRLPETIFPFFRLIGAFGYRTVKMVFPPDVQDRPAVGREPTFAEALAELGFHTDVYYVPEGEPLPRFVKFWRDVLPPRMTEMHERFMSVREEIAEIAFTENLRRRRTGQKSGKAARKIVAELMLSIRERDAAATHS